jgi:hypothetical protein
MAVPELPDDRRTLFARAGFNVIATANTRDRGVNEMSAALKRRFNFETVQPIADIREEIVLVQRETERLLSRAAIPVSMPPDVTEVLVTTFRELRTSKTLEGKGLEPVSSVLSTAEAVSTGFASAVHAYFYDDGTVRPAHLVQHFLGTVLKDSPDDLEKVKHYFQHVVKKRNSPAWQQLYDARTHLP